MFTGVTGSVMLFNICITPADGTIFVFISFQNDINEEIRSDTVYAFDGQCDIECSEGKSN
jgi:hypothetical protein